MEMTGEDDGYWGQGGRGETSLAFTQTPRKEFSIAKLVDPEPVCTEITSE